MTGYLRNYSAALQFVVFIGLALAFYLFTFLFMLVLLPHFTGLSLFDILNGDLSNPKVLSALKITQLCGTVISFLLPAMIYCYLLSPRPFYYVGLSGKVNAGSILLTLLTMACCLPMIGVLGDWNSHLQLTPSIDKTVRALESEADSMTKAILKMPTFISFLYSLFIIAIIPAIAEELFFRGVLQRILVKATHRVWAGVVLAAFLFSFWHFEFLGFLPRMMLGIVIGLIYAYSGNLWLAILAHFLNNGVQVVLVYLYQLKWIKFDVAKDTVTPLGAGLFSLLLVILLFWALQRVAAKKKEAFELSLPAIN
jgi:membrane protease YdiL (CAAX protease family)